MKRYAIALAFAMLCPTITSAEETFNRERLAANLLLYDGGCKTPLTETAKRVLVDIMKDGDTAKIDDEIRKTGAKIKQTGVGPWCRAMTKMIAAQSRLHEE